MDDFQRDSRKELVDLANARMPFGKYEGKLGSQLAQMVEIKLNGLEKLIYPLVRK